MSTLHRRTRKQAHPITEAAIQAFKDGDWQALITELHLPPWCWSTDLVDHPHGYTDEYGRASDAWALRHDVRDALLAAVASRGQ